MNFVWDLTSSAQAGRTELFENVNATPVPLMQQRLYEEYDTGRAERDGQPIWRACDECPPNRCRVAQSDPWSGLPGDAASQGAVQSRP